MDGVGGWADEGVDPAAYSNTFAEKSAAAVLMGVDDPRAVIAEAHEHTPVAAPATACVAVDGQRPVRRGERPERLRRARSHRKSR